jgi:hypothetical protein
MQCLKVVSQSVKVLIEYQTCNANENQNAPSICAISSSNNKNNCSPPSNNALKVNVDAHSLGDDSWG